MRRSVFVLLVALATIACGARTALDVDDAAPPIDARAPRDASISTLPCRWATGTAIEIEEVSDWAVDATGAVHAELATAVVAAERHGSTAAAGDLPRREELLVSLADPPVLLGPFGEPARPDERTREIFARPGGWVEIIGLRSSCLAVLRSPTGARESEVVLSGAQRCTAGALSNREIAIVLDAERAVPGTTRILLAARARSA